MKSLLFTLICFISLVTFSQEKKSNEEFIPIHLEGKEAFISTKTGEYIFLKHEGTDASKLETTASGVIHTQIQKHTVAKKETINKIAKMYGVSKEELLQENHLTSNKLDIGQELTITKKNIVKSSSPVISQGESTIIAKLQPGQTPTGLDAAPPYNAPTTKPQVNTEVSTKEIPAEKEKLTSEANEITNQKEKEKTKTIAISEAKDTVHETITEVEKIPAENANNYYTVKKGDTLFSIARKNGVSVTSLKKINNLTSNNLSIGQKLQLR